MSVPTNRAVVVTAPGELGVLAVQERPIPEPGPGQLLVRVIASGVNFKDVYERQGVYPVTTPFVLGSEGAGTVERLGSALPACRPATWWPGPTPGQPRRITCWSTPRRQCRVPAGVSAEVAAAAMLQGMTAHYLVYSTYAVQPGDAVLVHAAAGGVGQLLVQLAKDRGARVIATASTEAKAAKARTAGADVVIDYSKSTESVAAAVCASRTAGAGVGSSTTASARPRSTRHWPHCEPRGMMALFGAASGQVPPFDLQRLNSGGSLFLTRPDAGALHADP